MQRVIFTIDPLRVFIRADAQGRPHLAYFWQMNGKFCEALLSSIFASVASPLHCSNAWDDGPLLKLLPEDVISSEQLAAGPVAWNAAANAWWARHYRAASSELLAPFLERCSGALVIGFELSPASRWNLDRAGLTFIDVRVHPFRFLSDLAMTLETNRPNLFRGLRHFELTEARIAAEAGLVAAALVRRGSVTGKRLENAAVIFSQTWHDQNVIRGGRHITLLDEIERIQTLAARHDWLFLCPHPHGDPHLQVERAILRKLPARAEIRFAVGYAFFVVPGIRRVYSIGSSIGCEARRFGLESEFFNVDPEMPVDDLARDRIVLVEAFLDPEFWAEVLYRLGFHVPSRSRARSFFGRLRLWSRESVQCSTQGLMPGAVRTALNVDWGRDYLLEKGIDRPRAHGEHAVKRLYCAETLDPFAPDHTDAAFRLMLDTEANEHERAWHAAHRQANGPYATIERLNAHNENARTGSLDIQRFEAGLG